MIEIPDDSDTSSAIPEEFNVRMYAPLLSCPLSEALHLLLQLY